MRIAVVIPSWNNPDDVERCLRSLAEQTFRVFEVVVVDDGSDPTISEFPISHFQFPIRTIRQTHAGAPAARNRGARESESEFLIFLDADIALQPHALERLVAALDAHPNASFAYSGFRFGWKRFPSFPFDVARLRQMPYIHTSALIRRAHFPEFDESLRRFQDWDLWLTMLAQGHTGVHIPEVLFTVRNTRGTMSRWVPSFLHRVPWQRIGGIPVRIRAYDEAMAVIRKKHGI